MKRKCCFCNEPLAKIVYNNRKKKYISHPAKKRAYHIKCYMTVYPKPFNTTAEDFRIWLKHYCEYYKTTPYELAHPAQQKLLYTYKDKSVRAQIWMLPKPLLNKMIKWVSMPLLGNDQ